MKTLSTLMMCDFIELMCGKNEMVLEKNEKVSAYNLRAHAKRLKMDYNLIVNESAVRAVIACKSSDLHRLDRWQYLKNCLELLFIGGMDEVKNLMSAMGYAVKDATTELMEQKIKSEMRRIEFEQRRADEYQKDEEKDIPDSAHIRQAFDSEIASLMIFFKMGVDTQKISAAVYAHMVAQALREMRSLKKTVNDMKV